MFTEANPMTLAAILACREPWQINIDALRQELQSQFGLRPDQLQEELTTRPGASPGGATVVKLNGTPMAITVHNVPLPEAPISRTFECCCLTSPRAVLN